MKTLLQDITVFPEVTGAVVCDHAQGLLADTDLPPAFRGKPLAKICQSLGHLFALRDDITSMEMRYADGLLLASPISKTATLLTFCVPSANTALVNMTINMLLPNLQVAARTMTKPVAAPKATPAPVKPTAPVPAEATTKKTAKPAPPAKSTPPAKPAAKPVDVDALLSAGPLARTLVEFQSGLSYAIGPVGEMVMRDALDEWGKGGECSETRLNELVDILCREIDDTDLEEEFRKKVTPFM